MIWIGVVVAIVVLVAVGAVLLKRAHPPLAKAPEVPEADRIRRVTPAAPMVGLEAVLDGVTDGHGRTLRDHLDNDVADLERLRVEDDTSPILRRALDEVSSASPDVAVVADTSDTANE